MFGDTEEAMTALGFDADRSYIDRRFEDAFAKFAPVSCTCFVPLWDVVTVVHSES